MKPSSTSAELWNNANRRNAARIGLGDRAAAFHQIPTIKSLIRQIGTNPAALELLAARQHEMTPEQRTAALRAGCPPTKTPKVTKAAKPAMPAPGARRGLADVPLRGYHQ